MVVMIAVTMKKSEKVELTGLADAVHVWWEIKDKDKLTVTPRFDFFFFFFDLNN